jgi:acyl carrier protein
MSVHDRVFSAFKEALEIDEAIDRSSLVYRDYAEWTSIGHMTLVAALETEFDTMLDANDILDMSSFDKAVEIMGKYAAN